MRHLHYPDEEVQVLAFTSYSSRRYCNGTQRDWISIHCPLAAASCFLRLRTSIPFEAKSSFRCCEASLNLVFIISDSSIAWLYLRWKASIRACVPRNLILSFALSIFFLTSSCSPKTMEYASSYSISGTWFKV